MLRILFLDILTDNALVLREDQEIFHQYGGYRGIMERSLSPYGAVQYFNPCVHKARDMAALRDALPYRSFDVLVVGGSTVNVGPDDPINPWQDILFSLFRAAVRLNIPTLGICGGYQYGVRAFTRCVRAVIPNPAGRNFGTSPVRLTAAGRAHPLFKGLGEEILCQWSHSYVVDIESRADFSPLVLASHPLSPVAAFQYGSFIGLQWHPEFGALPESGYGVDIMRLLAEMRKERYFLSSRIAPAPDSAIIIKNWFAMV